MKLDDFESAFRSAFKEPFQFEPPLLQRCLLVTDLFREPALELEGRVRAYLHRMHPGPELGWTTIGHRDWETLRELLELIDRERPHLVVTYRHLLGRWRNHRHTLGSVLDTLTQATDAPVLVLPHGDQAVAPLPDKTGRVMVVTDHLTGDHRLVNWAAHMCADDGELFLTHIEDRHVFEKYMDVIERIPGIPSELVRERVENKLLQLPRDYIADIARSLSEHGFHEKIRPVVALGDPVEAYRTLVMQHEVDLLVANTRDERQEAMDALAYALAIELRDVPQLLL